MSGQDIGPRGIEYFDAVVVGGGPGGSVAAAAIALRGHRVLLLERERFPRYQIGESLLPSTVHGVCRIVGAADAIAEAGFTLKRGGVFRWGRNARPWEFSGRPSTPRGSMRPTTPRRSRNSSAAWPRATRRCR